MSLTEEQIKSLKEQLSQQIHHLPEDKRKEAQKQIEKMSDGALETMLKQQQSSQATAQQPVFRSVVSGEIPSKKLDENSHAIAVLDIKPISKGHTVIIPKNPITNAKDLPTSALTLAKKIAKKLSSKLKASGCEIQTQFAFGEIIVNVIPVYDRPLNINSPRQDASEEELSKLEKKLKVVKKPEVVKLTKKKSSKTIKLKRRVP